MTRKLLVATHNPGKVREYRELLAGLPLEVTYLDAEGITLEVEETGATFAENAILKATTYARASGLWTWADDSGLEVDALGGAPGVYSSRYTGPGASDADRYRKLLDALTGVSWDKRTARFRCTVALAIPHPDVPGTSEVPGTWSSRIRTADGVCEGIIAFGPTGDNGFGYDPVFYLPEHRATMAQLPAEAKNRISHRGRAAREAVRVLKEMREEPDQP
ncbi:MAG: RdgB/HAM1 family non-canonical purine NTP pyrophosphatase [Chloroflexi bacterium]|nr:RdgB/HAM1 family non-canonical purine NTP pyrophosphatase [Chloroflexota bacterium]